MRPLRQTAIILAGLAIIAALALGQAPPPYAVSPSSQAGSLRILAPQPGEKLAQSFVRVQYELMNPGAAGGGEPNFRVQLDARDPVFTIDTEQNFTGLKPGSHLVTVELVDANKTPVTGSLAHVRFVTVPQPSRGASGGSDELAPAGDASTSDPVPPQGSAETAALPSSNSALPLLSVIGFGALVGGIWSALKTR